MTKCLVPESTVEGGHSVHGVWGLVFLLRGLFCARALEPLVGQATVQKALGVVRLTVLLFMVEGFGVYGVNSM